MVSPFAASSMADLIDLTELFFATTHVRANVQTEKRKTATNITTRIICIVLSLHPTPNKSPSIHFYIYLNLPSTQMPPLARPSDF
jgi:hypothetical protein